MADDIKENAMSGGTPTRLRGLAANGNSISPTLEEVMNAMGIYTYSFTLAAKEEKDLGDLGYGMYLRLCKLNCVMLYSHSISSVGERPAPRGGTTRPDECKITTI